MNTKILVLSLSAGILMRVVEMYKICAVMLLLSLPELLPTITPQIAMAWQIYSRLPNEYLNVHAKQYMSKDSEFMSISARGLAVVDYRLGLLCSVS